MPVTRRDFVALLAAAAPVAAWRLPAPRPMRPGTPLRLDNNENPYGPSPAAREAMQRIIADGGRYPFDATTALLGALAAHHRTVPANLLLGVGSVESLAIATMAYTTGAASLLTAAPSYGTPVTTAERFGRPVIAIPLTATGMLDLDAMAARATGAGLVFICNPNNPSGTVLPADRLRAFIRTVHERSPATVILIDEAYHEYVADPAYASMVPDALATPRLLVSRTFSKLHGLAGLRLGYLVGRPETLAALPPFRVPIGANTVAVAAATAALGDREEVTERRARNAEARAITVAGFRRRGLAPWTSETNFVYVDIGRDANAFRTACLERGVRIARPWPGMPTFARVSLGTPEEMTRAVTVFDAALG